MARGRREGTSAHSFPAFSSPCRYCGALASEVEPGTCTGKPQPPRSISRARVREIATEHMPYGSASFNDVVAAIRHALRELGITVEE